MKLVMLREKDKYMHLPEYKLLFNPGEYAEPGEGIISPLNDYNSSR